MIKGVKVFPRAPTISHLLFADNSLLFGQASCSKNESLRNLLDLYERNEDAN